MCTFQFPIEGISYTKAEQKIIDYIYQNLYNILFLSIGQLADLLHVSEATISRFVRHAGFADFKALKNAIAQHLGQESPSEKLSTTITKDHSNELFSLMQYQQHCISKTLELINEDEFLATLNAILKAQHIYLYGKGAAKSLCCLLQFRFNRFGKKVTLLPSGGSELFEDLVHITSQDLILLFSFQKLSSEAKVILQHAKDCHCPSSLFTSKIYDQPTHRADYNLYVYRGEAKEYHSMTVPIALIDTLVIMLGSRMGASAMTHLDALHHLKQHYEHEIPR